MKKLALLACLVAFPASAQWVSNPPPSFFPYSHIRNSAQGHKMAWVPYQQGPGTIGTQFNVIGTGRTNIGVVELEGDPVWIQPIFNNTQATPWTVAQMVISPTATYSGNVGAGTDPYDSTLTRQLTMIPVTFTGGGEDVPTWNNQLARYTGSNLTSGNLVVALSLNAAVPSGSTLGFGSTISNQVIGKFQPTVGMYVFAGNMNGATSCIVPGTKITSVNATQIGLDTAVAGAGCLNNQNIYFSYQPVTTAALSMTLSASTNGLNGIFAYGDWMLLPSIPRNDGGFVVGMKLTQANIPVGTTITAVGPRSLTMSQNVTGDIPIDTSITATMNPVTTAQAVSGQVWFQVDNAYGLQEGQILTGDAAIPANTWVTGVQGNIIFLSAMLTGTVATGTTLTATNTFFTRHDTDTPSGNVLPLYSTNNKRLYTWRVMAASGNPSGLAFGASGNQLQAEDQLLGLPNYLGYQTALTTDGMNAINAAQNNTVSASNTNLVYGFRYLTRQRGSTVCTYGSSHVAGGGTYSGSNSYAKLAAAQVSTRQRPVSFVNSANGGTTPATFANELSQWIQNGTCSVIVMQYGERNDPNVANQQGNAIALSDLAVAAGARVIWVTDMARSGNDPWTWTVDADVNNSTTVPLRNFAFGAGYLNGGGSGYFITGTGIPANTTYSYAIGNNFLTLSQPATIRAGTLITGFTGMTVTTSSGLTSVTLAQPAPLTIGYNVASDTNNRITAGTVLNVTQNSTSATLAANALSSGTTVVTMKNISNAAEPQISQEMGYAQAMVSPSQSIANTYWCGMDPAAPGYWARGMSVDLVHASDNGLFTFVNGDPNAPGGGCPSFATVLRQAVGN